MIDINIGIKAVILLIGASIFIAFLVHRPGSRLPGRRNSTRLQDDDAAFVAQFYSHDSIKGDIAARVRRGLAENLGSALDELYPDSNLDDDLGVQLEANPDLFWGLEKEFAIELQVDDYEKFQFYLNKIRTFSDLVEFVQFEMAAAAKRPERSNRIPKRDALDYVLDSIPYFCGTGLLTMIIGEILGVDWTWKFGTALFLSGFAIWSFVGGGTMLINFVSDIRSQIANPRKIYLSSAVIAVCMIAGLLTMGGFFLWMIIRMYVSE